MPSTHNTHEHLLIDGGRFGVSIIAEITYGIEPASGNGRDEPRDPGGPYIIAVLLIKETAKSVFHGYESDSESRPVYTTNKTREYIPGEAPDWVLDVLENDEWASGIEYDDGPDPDHAYDTMRDRQLVEGSL